MKIIEPILKMPIRAAWEWLRATSTSTKSRAAISAANYGKLPLVRTWQITVALAFAMRQIERKRGVYLASYEMMSEEILDVCWLIARQFRLRVYPRNTR